MSYHRFVIMGNHDFGNADPAGLCPFFAPRVTCPGAESGCGGAKPFSNQSQPLAKPFFRFKELSKGSQKALKRRLKRLSRAFRTYAFNQLNVDKGGIGGDVRSNFHAPDFTYYYTIPDLDYVSCS